LALRPAVAVSPAVAGNGCGERTARGAQLRQNRGMRVTARADYAVRAAIELVGASAASPRKADSVAVAQGIPLSFLENILNQLKSAGVVRSQRGPEGGWWLLREPDTLTLADVIRGVEGPLASVRGERPENLAYEGSAESLQEVWIALRANIRAVLEQVTLADVASGRLPKQVAALARGPTAWTSG
jgi:Rrf2 family protein